jgi:AraC-like DNA-binding protein
VDQLAGFLDGPRARGAFLLRSLLDPPWSLRIQDEAPLTLVAVVRGDAWVVHDGDEPQRIGPGDTAIIRGPEPYTVADDPATTPQIVIHPGQRCTTPEGVSLSEAMALGVRSWGTNADGSVALLTGTYTTDGEVSRWLLEALPRLMIVTADDWESPLPALLAVEITRDEPGQEVVLDRLLDLLLVATLRAAFARADADVPSWYRAHGDPVVGKALRLIHGDPSHPWTVASLAAGSGVSRALLARRFHELVGEPPMAFLTHWRMALAADLLLEPEATVGGVARRVGYGSPFTFSTAFKRTHGASPSAHRQRGLAAAAVPASA